MRALSFPFRFTRGAAATVDVSSDAFAAQRLASAASTRLGELPLLPRFGITDPEFDEFDSGGLYFTCATYFPDIDITNLLQSDIEDGSMTIEIEFQVRRGEASYGIA
jgi:hypothetical protein